MPEAGLQVQQPGSAVQPPGSEGKRIAIIDVMIVYTPATTAALGGPNGVSGWIVLAIAEVNQVFEHSLINARLRLIPKQEVQYEESGDSTLQTDYARLVDPADGYLDEVPVLGRAWGADLISLWVTHPNVFESRAEPLTQVRPSKDSIVVARYAPSTGTPRAWHFAHELGHNLGCDHSPVDNSGPAGRYFAWSLGNWLICRSGDFSGVWVDIMAFAGDIVPVYLNPRVSFTDPVVGNVCPTGIAPPEEESCDCAGTINRTAPIVEAYATATFLVSPRMVNAGQPFEFQIQGPPGATCSIEASSDLLHWIGCGSMVLSDTGSGCFVDNQAGAASCRFYRVRPPE